MQLRLFAYKDTDEYDTDDTGVLGVFEPNGNGSCYYKNGSLRFVS